MLLSLGCCCQDYLSPRGLATEFEQVVVQARPLSP